MNKKNILVTGGAGFIGSFLVDELVKNGHAVCVIDSLVEQVHRGKKPSYLNPKVSYVFDDVCNHAALRKVLTGVDVVYHLASRVGVGQSNYEIQDYIGANVGGMAALMHTIVNDNLPVEKVIMTASMTSYGEGAYRCRHCGPIHPQLRNASQMKKRNWELTCPDCGSDIVPIPTDERVTPNNNSVYSFSKHAQEEMLLLVGKLYGIPVVSLRCFNVYGPRQSLSNPYTGVSAIFISRLKNNKPPVVYEDGMQTRDFVSVHDVVQALILTMESEKASYQTINVGSGIPVQITDIALTCAKLMGKPIVPVITGDYRLNDIRHCYADIAKAKKLLGWKPKVTLSQGLAELIAWSKTQKALDLFDTASRELVQKKLLS